jgi:PrtD family type I secretion system ABC transporter
MQQQMKRSWIKYMVSAGIFKTALNLVYLAIPVYMSVVYDRVLYSFSAATLYTLGAGMLICLLVMATLEYIGNRILILAGTNLVEKMASPVLTAMQKTAVDADANTYTRGFEDLETLRDAMIHSRFFSFLDIPWVVIYLALLYIMHPLVGLIAMAGVFIAAGFQILLRILEKKRYAMADVGMAAGRADIHIGHAHAELVAGLGMAPGIRKKFNARQAKTHRIKSRADGFHIGIGAIIRFVHLVFLTGVFTAGTWAFFQNQITPGIIFAGVMIAVRIMMLLEHDLTSMKASIDGANAFKRLSAFVPREELPENTVLPKPKGQLTVKGLTLSVPGRALLQNIGFELETGQMLGIIGPCDSGKTVLCRLLAGIWTPGGGEIRLDGAKLTQWPRLELGSHIGYMPQTPDLLPGTVAENIARFTDGPSEAIIEAARRAGVHEMILKLPQVYDTPVIGSGSRISAGRRQLISLARALYADPCLMIMDEPQTFLDDTGIRALLSVLNGLKQQKTTTVVVTDRPAILNHMDKLLVIKAGQPAMYGQAGEIMARLSSAPQSHHHTPGE